MAEEQMAQCRKEFEAFGRPDGISDIEHFLNETWFIRGFKAAWRPVPTVEQIEEIIIQHTEAYVMMRVGVNANAVDCKKTAKAIHAAFGGKNEL